jgi:hypothetical protein
MRSNKNLQGLVLPTQSNNSDGPEISSESIERTINELSNSDTHEKFDVIYRQIQQSNRYNYDWKKRFEYLELLEPTVNELLNILSADNREISFPLDTSSKEINLAYNSLCLEVAKGYKICLQVVQNVNTLTVDALISTITYKVMRYISYNLLNSYLHYSEPETGLWYELHQLYLYAVNKSIHQEEIEDRVLQNRKEDTIEKLYLTNILFSAIKPSNLLQHELIPFYKTIESWSQYVEIKPVRTNYLSLAVRTVDFNSDKSPYIAEITEDFIKSDSIRVIRTTTLVEGINSFLKGVDSSELLEPLENIEQFSRHLLKQTITSLSHKQFRSFPRRKEKKSKTINVMTDFDRIHKVISSTYEININSLEKELRIHIQENDDDEVKATGFYTNAVNNSIAEHRVQPLTIITSYWQQWKIINSSPTGYRLISDDLNTGSIKVGELIALNPEFEDNICSIGVIRWLTHVHDHKIEVGVEVLAPHASPIVIMTAASENNTNTIKPGFLLPHIKVLKRPQSLITPIKTFSSGDKLTLASNDNAREVIIGAHGAGNNYSHYRLK